MVNYWTYKIESNKKTGARFTPAFCILPTYVVKQADFLKFVFKIRVYLSIASFNSRNGFWII
ncbi:hypothetical protein SAMN04488524_4276 [Pedobacter africanus]|uniref:Uncharacterized protein n=1 Tax=Pedobacter africanus TaxID=151894 RepID=A0A1W2DYY9_9SPHI|nr:hypothetical protein SAMN04488524_4276 [Pedobacter africanus]